MEPLYERVLAFIADPAADRFEDLALAIFAHQFAHCGAYRDFARRRGASPEMVTDWRDVPAVPIVAFRLVDLICGVPQRIFRSSGTTQGAANRSRHLLPDLRLYRASALAGLRRFLFPDVTRMRAVSLIPTPAELPDSSLAQMVAWALETFAADGAYAARADGLDLDRLVAALEASERDGQPLAILATSGALIRALDALRERGRAFRLPHGSRLMDTGGDKGAPRHLSRNGLLHAVWSAFAIPGYFVVNEYGMAELSSQYYDSSLADRVAGHHAPRRKLGPHWARARLLDPTTLAPAAPGEVGLLCHVDLANAGSAMAILSEDLAVAVDDGFALRGRAPGAEERGCSLTAARWDAA
ncbi:MAG TPA: long-chain fatty acid--CoA ligase [Candidatus Dormibacteraeota bacterium]|nr:long-chain fatty acid--CoA ligase [Candidatus Dormibacteraeota bacterium]